MTFAEPHYFWAMAVLPVLALFFIKAEKMRRMALDQLLAARLQGRLAGSVSVGRRRFAFVLLLLGLALCITALARPRWGVTFEEQGAVGRDVLLAMDTSRSMLAQDVAPNRLERAKFAALDLLRELEGDKVGLVAFAGDAFLQAPLTPDKDTIEKSLRGLDTEAISQGGSNLALAIETAAEAFGKGESDQRALIFFSDGEELQEDALEAATKYKDKFRIFTIGVGTATGAPIVMQTRMGSEYIRDEGGNVVTTKLDESRLQEVAKRGGGFYLRLQNGPADMRDLAKRGLGNMREKETGILKREIPNEWFQWPLVGGIAVLMISILLGERRRVARVAVIALMLCLPHPAEAGRLGRSIGRAFGGDNAEAPENKAETPEDSVRRLEGARNARPGVPELDYNVGCAAFAAGDYEKAATAFSIALGSGVPEIQARAAYNLANSLARRGVKAEKEKKIADWTNALQQYDHALNLQPGNEDAKTNRAIVQKALDALKEQEKKEQEQQKKEDEKKDKKKDGDQKEKKDNKGENGEKSKPDEQKEGDGKEGDKKDGDPKDGKNPDEKKDGDKKGDEKKGGSNDGPKPGEENKGDNADTGKPGKPAEPADQDKAQDVKPDEKPGEQRKDGQLQQAGEPNQDKEAQEAAEAAQAAREGRMTEKDAKQLLQSMRRHEGLVRPQQLVPQRRPQSNGKNW